LHVYDGSGDREEAAVAESMDDVAAVIAELQDEMQEAAGRLEFERAALLRDQIDALKSGDYRKANPRWPRPYAPRKKGGALPAGRRR
jgi:excinuclease ABC subunit B